MTAQKWIRRNMKRFSSVSIPLACLVLGILAVPATLEAAPPAPGAILAPHEPGVLLVQFRPGAASSARSQALAAVGASKRESVSPIAGGLEKLTLSPGRSIENAISALTNNPNVEFVEPNYVVQTQVTSDDTYFVNNDLWGMYGDTTSPANQFGSQAAEVWAENVTGSDDVYVVIIDEGVQVTHPDLAANVWVNPFDPTDGIDNDGNGYVDDINGWDFYNDDPSVFDIGTDTFGDPFDAHGTHVAGTIGAVGGNGVGVAGVNWNVTLISTKFLGPGGGYTSDAVRAVDYATDLKVRHGLNIVATSNSWGGGGFSQALRDAIDRGGDQGILFVAAAGNESLNVDQTAAYPQGYQCTRNRNWDCVVSVASITSSGALSSFSNFGATMVDIGAPGSGIVSTFPTNSYVSYSGTSMATPHVSGALALCESVNPSLTAAELRSALLTTAVPTSTLTGKVVSNGRLDVAQLISACKPSGGSTLAIPSSVLPPATRTVSYSAPLVATGGTGPYTWSQVSGSLPTGVTLSGGALAGTPSATGTFNFVLEARDAVNAAVTRSFSMSVTEPVAVGTSSLPAGAVGSAYSQSLGGTGGAAPYNWSLASGTLPAGLSMSAGGSITGTPSTSGTYSFSARVTDSAGREATGSLTLVINPSLSVAASSLPPATRNQVYSTTFSGSGGVTPYSWSRTSGTLPSGLSLSSGGVLSGTPSSTGTWSFTVTARDATGRTASRSFSINVTTALSITTTSLPSGTRGVSYSRTLSASGGRSPYAWSRFSGTLPPGLTLSSGGAISGRPTTAGSFTFTVQVRDSAGRTATRSYTVTIR